LIPRLGLTSVCSCEQATDAPAQLVPKFAFRDVAESVLVGAIPDQLTAANAFIPNFQNYARCATEGALSPYRDTSLTGKRPPLGPYRMPVPRALGVS